MMKKVIGVVLFFSTLCAPAIAGGQNGGISAPRTWSQAPSGPAFGMPAPVRIEPIRTPVVNNGSPQKLAPSARRQTPFPYENQDGVRNWHYNPYFNTASCDFPYDTIPIRRTDCSVNPYYGRGFGQMFFDTNL